jgi:predicted nucleotidyltransferase
MAELAIAHELARVRHVLERITETHGARNLRVVGSVARGDPRSDSDVDLVVDIDDQLT